MLAQAKTADDLKLGENIIITGLFIQIAFFGFFIVVSALFHYRISLYPTARSRMVPVPWRRYLWVLYAASALVMIRSIFRLAEYIQGSGGALQSKEGYIYVLDALLMFIVSAIFNVYHPSSIINETLSQKFDMEADTEYVMESRKRGGYETVEV